MNMLVEYGKAIGHRVNGAAAIEFAIILPALILLVFGGVAGWRFTQAAQRVDHVAYTISDLSSRLQSGTTEGDVTNMLNGALFIAKPLDMQADGNVILSAVDSGGGRKILWQRCIGNASSFSKLGVEGEEAKLSEIARSPVSADAIFFITESRLDYKPPFFGTIFGPVTLKHVAIVPGRGNNPGTLTPGGEGSSCAFGAG
jgi:Flp pilus assembly protein TadG